MRKIILFTNISLDGYFEAPGGDITGFKNDNEAFSSRGDQEIDALLFGHKTYELMKFWTTLQAQEMLPDVALFMNETPKLVASHRDFDPGWNNVQVVSGDVVEEIKKLKEQPGNDIMMFGSNMLCVSLMEHGLVDEFQIVVNPVVFGGGTPLFHGLPGKADLRLVDARKFASGTVLLTYHK